MQQLLSQEEMLTFGEARDQELKRDTIVAVVYDAESGLFLCQHWPEYNGLTCMLSGGVESGEDWDAAVSREIAEETGYTDFTVMGILGSDIESHYTKADGQNYVKILRPYLVKLHSTQQVADQKEDDEKFDNIFKKPEEILAMMSTYEEKTGSTLADHKEILKRGVEYTTTEKK